MRCCAIWQVFRSWGWMTTASFADEAASQNSSEMECSVVSILRTWHIHTDCWIVSTWKRRTRMHASCIRWRSRWWRKLCITRRVDTNHETVSRLSQTWGLIVLLQCCIPWRRIRFLTVGAWSRQVTEVKWLFHSTSAYSGSASVTASCWTRLSK
jgi:hypothetical protein